MPQGGCVALEDGIVLAQLLMDSWQSAADLGPLLAQYEKRRAMRCLPLAVRSRAMGMFLQTSSPPLVVLRDTAVSQFVDPGHFFDHTFFDVGSLQVTGAGNA
jgi:2-polyprenyl-6-methoxyphenol hydroxylase-like FAD-dependent oxidoreductase